jgi:hypothetical protein
MLVGVSFVYEYSAVTGDGPYFNDDMVFAVFKRYASYMRFAQRYSVFVV